MGGALDDTHSVHHTTTHIQSLNTQSQRRDSAALEMDPPNKKHTTRRMDWAFSTSRPSTSSHTHPKFWVVAPRRGAPHLRVLSIARCNGVESRRRIVRGRKRVLAIVLGRFAQNVDLSNGITRRRPTKLHQHNVVGHLDLLQARALCAKLTSLAENKIAQHTSESCD